MKSNDTILKKEGGYFFVRQSLPKKLSAFIYKIPTMVLILEMFHFLF